MTGRYLLDTDTLSDLMRNPLGSVYAQVELVGEAAVFTSIIVASELRFGAARRKSASLARQIEILLGPMEVASFESPADRIYAELRSDLERRGQPIGANDLFVAAHALCLGVTLVSGNVREFSRISGLHVENWISGKKRLS